MKNILVTGCSKGIGFEIVKVFAKRSDIRVLAVSRDQIGLNKLEIECIKINQEFNVYTMSVDLSTIESIDQIIQYIKIEFQGILDGVIHNAGFLVNKKFENISIEELEYSFKVNSFAPFILTQRLIPFLNKKAHILSISSMGGIQGTQKFPGLSAYSTSKSTLITLTECLAEEYKMSDFYFNCLALGAVQTEMLKKAFPDYTAPIKSQEMGEFIFDFFINGFKYFNGQVIPVSLTTP